MFNIEGDAINISLDMGLDEVSELKEFLESKLDYIEEVGIIKDDVGFVTSSLFQLLVSLKKSKPEIKIPFLDNKEYTFAKFGKVEWKNG